MEFKMNNIEKLMKKCRYCGNDFRSSREKRRYCSEECFENFQKERRREYSQKNKDVIYKRRTTCKYCGNKFNMKELKERCCNSELCIKEKEKEKNRIAKRKYYNKHIKPTTNKFKKRDAENSRNYRRTHTEEINKRDSARKKEKREWINSLKNGKKCLKCGEDRLFCLVYHHKDPKEKDFTISQCISYGYGKERIVKEIEKCVLLCSNCHHHLHYLQREIEGWEPSEEWLNNKDIFK